MPTTLGTEITPMDLRAHTGDILDHVRLRHDVFVIKRRGVPMAALVPVERLRRMEELASKYARLMSRIQQQFNDGSGADLEEIEREAEEATRRVRAGPRRKRP